MKEFLSPVFGIIQIPDIEPQWLTGYSYLLFTQNTGLTLPVRSVYMYLTGNGSVTATIRRGTTKLADSVPTILNGPGFYRFHFSSNVNLLNGQSHRLYLNPSISVGYFTSTQLDENNITYPTFGARVGTTNRYDIIPLMGFVIQLF